MRSALIDTNILSMFFRGHPWVVKRFEEYSTVYSQINFSIITYYEILSGLKHRDAHKQMERFLQFADLNNVVFLEIDSVVRAADIYAATRTRGTPVDDIDILIAGTALTNQWALVTNNRSHFEKIDDLVVEDWSIEEQVAG